MAIANFKVSLPFGVWGSTLLENLDTSLLFLVGLAVSADMEVVSADMEVVTVKELYQDRMELSEPPGVCCSSMSCMREKPSSTLRYF